jgi:phosphomannomutase
MSLIRGISGIRGIVGQTLSDKVISLHSMAFNKIQPVGKILVARDSRYHGEDLSNIAIKSLLDMGRDVVDCGIVPTPTAQFMIEKHGYAGGIVVTASHNPEVWNGMKFIDYDGCFLGSEKNNQLFSIADENTFQISTIGKLESNSNAISEHIEHTKSLSVIDKNKIINRRFKVVVDAVNGAASVALPEMVRALGCEVIPIYNIPNGKFPRGAEPLPHHLIDLGNAVKSHHADVGFATDPDGDRLAIVDENGRPIGEEYTLTICADGILSQADINTPIVTNLSTTMALDKLAERYNLHVKRSAVGEINVVNMMKDKQSVIGGEGNGGVILPESHYGRDSLVGAALFLNRMTQTTDTVSTIFKSMPQFVMAKEKIELDGNDPDKILVLLSTSFADVNQNKVDGLKLTWEDRWLHVRKSNTEPIIRIYAEAPTETEVNELVQKVKQLLEK